MTDYHIQLPPMPKPEDFGITEEDWAEKTNASLGKLRAYRNAVAKCKEAVASLKNAE